MERPSTQRGSLLSSIVMVMLATVATGMLAFIGFQALPDSVIPATFGGDDRSSRHVDVSDSPSPESTGGARPTAVPSTKPPVPVQTANPRATSRPTQATYGPRPTRTGSTTVRTTAPKPTTTTAAPRPKPTTTTAPPKVTPSPTQSTQTASPAPSCGSGRKPRCPRSAEPQTSPTRQSSYDDTSYAPTKSSTEAGTTKKSSKTTSKSTSKPAPKRPAKR